MNAELYHMNDDLLVKYLLGEASAGERREVEVWIDADPENQRYFNHFKLIWDESQQLAAESTVDENDAWQRFQHRIGAGEDGSPLMTVVKPAKTKWYDTRVAASVIMLLGLAALLFFVLVPFKNHRQVVVTASARAEAKNLPDGSVVTLNKNSTISFAEGFSKKDRVISLQGEAFFQVQPDKTKPFIVTVNDITITVLGTSFNVKTVNGKTEVIVETGLVKVERNARSVQLKPKEKLEIEASDTALVKEPVTDQLYKFYRTREFVCDGTPLWKLVEAINEAYNVNIVIENPALKSLPVTTQYYDESLDKIFANILDIFPEYDIKIERKDPLIILK